MGRLTTHYFTAMDSIRKNRPVTADGCGAERQADHVSGIDINALLKDAFQSLCRAANTLSPQQVVLRVEGEYVTLLRSTLAVR